MVEATSKMGGVSLITADHGNAERMSDANGEPFTAHTTNLVPFYIVVPASNCGMAVWPTLPPPCWTSWAWKSPPKWMGKP